MSNKKFAILGYSTINIGDDIQSFVTSTLLNISYIVMRDDYEKIYDYHTGELITNIDETIYLIMNGWFMHEPDWKRQNNNNIKFPIKNNKILPIYISTCLSKDIPQIYKPDCIEHYKKYSPIMCRDKTTLNLLKSKGVDSEYYGCLTQTLDIENVPGNEKYKEEYKDSIIYIDCPKEWDKRNKDENNHFFKHYINDIIIMNPKNRIDYARDLISKYKYAKKIYTHRLHAFLPCRAMGLDVEYVGDINYRVCDLVNCNPDKSKLNEIFLDYIHKKTTN